MLLTSSYIKFYKSKYVIWHIISTKNIFSKNLLSYSQVMCLNIFYVIVEITYFKFLRYITIHFILYNEHAIKNIFNTYKMFGTSFSVRC